MIHHISISAENPRHVAEVLAEVLGGRSCPFPPHPGSFMAMAGDTHGTGIEVYPHGSELIPGNGDEDAGFGNNTSPSRYNATHAAISVPLNQEQIEQIAAREGWRTRRFSRGNGAFDVIEFWIENRQMIELLTPEMAAQYLASLAPENLERLVTMATPA
jgi:hypothetical protein